QQSAAAAKQHGSIRSAVNSPDLRRPLVGVDAWGWGWQSASTGEIDEVVAIVTRHATVACAKPNCAISTTPKRGDFVGCQTIPSGEADEIRPVEAGQTVLCSQPERASGVEAEQVHFVVGKAFFLSEVDELSTVVARQTTGSGEPQIAARIGRDIKDF